MKFEQHPLSAAFPAMSAEDFQALRDSIESIGVQNPVTLYQGMVIDGWHRYSAAMALGMACPTVELGDIDPRDFVLAQNKARRHVTQAQMALAVTTVHAWKPVGANQHRGSALSADPPEKTVKELAAVAGVGERTVAQAKTVQTKAAPEVQEAVKRGEIGLPKAAKIAQLPKEEQAAAIHQPVPQKQREPEPVEPINEADGGQSPQELIGEIQRENTQLHARLKAMESDDTKAELHKALLQRDHAQRQQSEAMDRAAREQKAHAFKHKQLMRCGKAVGETDPDKIAAAVEAFARQRRVA